MKQLLPNGSELIVGSGNLSRSRRYDPFTTHGDWLWDGLWDTASDKVAYFQRWKLKDGSQPYYVYLLMEDSIQISNLISAGGWAFGYVNSAGQFSPAFGEFYNASFRARLLAKLTYEEISSWLAAH